MFVTTLAYTVGLDQIEEAMPDHIAWLEGHYADGVIVVSGRQMPRVGGVVVWRTMERADLEVRVAADPFVARGLATVTIVEFQATRAGEGLAGLIDSK